MTYTSVEHAPFTATCPAWCRRDMRIDGKHSHISAPFILPVVDVPEGDDPELWPHIEVETIQHPEGDPQVVVWRSLCEGDEGEYLTLDQAQALHRALGEAITRLREASR